MAKDSKVSFVKRSLKDHHNLELDKRSRQRHWSLFLRHELRLPIVPSPFFRWRQFVKQHISKQKYPLSKTTIIVLKYLSKPFRNTTSMASILTGNTQVFILWETICQNVITFLFRQEGREPRGQRKLHSPDKGFRNSCNNTKSQPKSVKIKKMSNWKFWRCS